MSVPKGPGDSGTGASDNLYIDKQKQKPLLDMISDSGFTLGWLMISRAFNVFFKFVQHIEQPEFGRKVYNIDYNKR